MFFLKSKIKEKTNVVISLCFLIFICQVCIWPLWFLGYRISFILIFILFLYTKKAILQKFQSSSRLLLPFLLFFIYYILYFGVSGDFQGSSVLYFLLFMIVVSLSHEEKIRILQIITVYFATIIAISFPLWFLHTFGLINLPLFSVIDLQSMKGLDESVLMGNFFFFVQNLQTIDAPRFYSMFDEPGVVGTVGAFILLAQKYNFSKWYNVVILIGCIFTYSFAFYVLTSLGYVLCLFLDKKKSFKSLLFILLSIPLIFVVMKNNSTFEAVLLSKWDNGLEESLNSRTSDKIGYYIEKALDTGDIFLGYGNSFTSTNLNQDGASYKIFLLSKGLIGCVILFFIYYSIIEKCTKMSLLILFMYCVSFSQRAEALSAYQIILYTLSIANVEYKKSSIKIVSKKYVANNKNV